MKGSSSTRAAWLYALAGTVAVGALGVAAIVLIPRLAFWWLANCPATSTLVECRLAEWMLSYWWVAFIAVAMLVALGLNRMWARGPGRSAPPAG